MLAPRSPSSARLTFGVLLIVSLLLVGALVWPLRQPLFLAAVLAASLSRVHARLARRLGDRRGVAAAILLIAVLGLVVVPLSGIATFAVSEGVEGARYVRDAVSQGGVEPLLVRLPAPLDDWARRLVLFIPNAVDELDFGASGRLAAQAVGGALSATSRAALFIFITLFASYVFLRDGRRLIGWVARVLPLPAGETEALFAEFRAVSSSVLGSTVAVAAAQSLAASIGFLVVRVPHAAFFGLTCFFAAFIPAVGTAIVAVPLGAVLWGQGHPFRAAFVVGWSLVVVSSIDNLAKPLFIRWWGGVNLPGAVIFLALLGGLLVFGPLGFIAGPLSVSFFVAMTRLGKRDLDGAPPGPLIELAPGGRGPDDVNQ